MLPERDRLIIYVQSYDTGTGRYLCDDTSPTGHDQISIVSIPKRNPANARVVAEPKLFPDGGNDGTTGTLRATTGCHDITVYQEIGLAAGACTGEGVILDIRNPVRPKVLVQHRGHELRVLAQRHDQQRRQEGAVHRRAGRRQRSRRATRRSARAAAPTRSTTSPIPPTRGS